MKQRSPTIEGFRLMFSRPILGLAEIAWRWTFGSAAILSVAFLILEYFRTLPVTPADIFLLRTRRPLLISQAMANIFRGSADRFGKSAFLLFILLSVAWIVLASWARRGTVNALINYFREESLLPENSPSIPAAKHRSPFGLNLLRVAASIAAVLACLGTFFLAGAVSPSSNPSPGAAMLVFLTLVMGIFLAWWLLNWLFSLAAIFVVADGDGTFKAISRAVDLWQVRWGAIAAAGTWFGLAHTIIFFVASSVIAFPLAFVGTLPFSTVIGGMLLVTLVYFAATDYLYAGKMAAYVAIAELPYEVLELPYMASVAASVDRNELILSDVPPVET